jgi:TatD DNase family protein
VGIHPWNAQNVSSEELDQIYRLMREKRVHVSAIGEIGLDKSYTKNQDHFKRQSQLFERQLTLAQKMNLPIIVHSRGSAREVLDTLSSHNQKKALMHWYNDWKVTISPAHLDFLCSGVSSIKAPTINNATPPTKAAHFTV